MDNIEAAPPTQTQEASSILANPSENPENMHTIMDQDHENDGDQEPMSRPQPPGGKKTQYRKVLVPPNRMTPLKNSWMEIYEPVVKQLKLQIRMNLRNKCVELKTCALTTDPGALQKGADFVKAFILGFAIRDAIAILRLEELYVETFEIQDVKELEGDHKSRAIGRIAGKDGKTKFTIENATKTRIVLADTKIHILGSFQNIRLAREAIVSLILGTPPGKVYNKLKMVASRLNESF